MYSSDYQSSDYDDDEISISRTHSIVIIFILFSTLLCFVLVIIYYSFIHINKQKKVIAISMLYRGVESKYSSEISYTPEVCAICYEDYKEGDKIFSLTCDHSFHHECVKILFNKNTINAKCPCCNRVVLSERREV